MRFNRNREYIEKMLGFHEFAEFVADVGTVDSGLNSMVLANNDEFVLLPINEPTFGTRRKSQIQTYLEATTARCSTFGIENGRYHSQRHE